ncbi:EpsG family protein [Glaciimonas sp. PCH181]|uniref:EpsG family protein n=1 Tax=Glaciimonas sp. PCH181 TaxID=2133943 RepID=UPI000D385790|nr:EpsG family protein [Glaciimonas sp. PCH181]PUA20525.1 hypothetical protein C7W93_12475 [Glaciimonas sp. PCH181]
MNLAIVYYGITAVLLIFCEFLYLFKKTQVVLVFIILFFILGGSHFNGADWINYTNVFDKLNELPWIDVFQNPPFEILYSLALKFFSVNYFNYQSFVVVIAFFNLFFLMFIANRVKVSNIPFLFLIIFFIEGWSLFQEQIRQSIAVILCLYAAYEFFLNNKKRSYLLIFIAIGFHNSAIFGVLYLYVAKRIIDNNRKPLKNNELLKVFYFVVFCFISIIVISKVNFLQYYIPLILQEKINYYINDEISSSSLLNVGLLIYPIGFVILLARRKYVIVKDNYWLSFAWSMGMIWCMVGPILRLIAIFTRFEHYFLLLLPFALVSYGSVSGTRDFLKIELNKLITLLFGLTFLIRLIMQPAQSVWVEDYQNSFMSYIFNTDTESSEFRKDKVCNVLLDNGNDFCGMEQNGK